MLSEAPFTGRDALFRNGIHREHEPGPQKYAAIQIGPPAPLAS